VEERLDPVVLGFLDGRPGGGPELRGWLRLADGREPDPLALLLAVDAYPPATFELGTTGWVPTLQLTAYVRGLPAPGPLRVRQRTRLVQGDLVDEQCEVWDSAGRLVASATQLAGLRVVTPLPRPRPSRPRSPAGTTPRPRRRGPGPPRRPAPARARRTRARRR
jgi:hypothetical protein